MNRLKKIEDRWGKKPPTNKPVRAQDRDDVEWLVARVKLLEERIEATLATSSETWVHETLGGL